jgi:hypothetical protein
MSEIKNATVLSSRTSAHGYFVTAEGILDLSHSGLEIIDADGTNSREIILSPWAKHIDVRNSPELRKLILPKGVKTANVSNCPNLGAGLVMLGLLESVVLCDLEAIRTAIRNA